MPVREAEPYVKVLLYGRNGKGKTRTAATGPKPLIADINEKGTKSIRNYDAHVFHVKAWEDVVYLYWFLKQGDHDFETVVLDTLTALQNMCIAHVLKESEDRDPNKDPHTMSMREWGKVGELMKPLLLNFRNLPMHVVFVAQERSVDNEEGESEKVPDLSPASRATAMSSVDIIGRIFQKEVRVINKQTQKETKAWETLMLVGPHEVYTTKDRTGVLPRIVRKPTIKMLIKASQSEEE